MASPEAGSVKKFKQNYTDKIMILVGPSEVAFTVDKLTACARSPFFQKALRSESEWRNPKDGVITIANAEPEILAIYAHWMYKSEVSLEHITRNPLMVMYPSFLALAKAWILGDMLLDYEFCN